ncbi:hypothetical protein H8356DRAFT_1752422 [Neocallimastix lanati (nom. inval.)]|uniref:Chitin-binding type-1 domain-containing protein n=1 Tax=Neocallimastix californiae TaxID=1754190 RepID=A0A1Y1YI68_9FUNG|nr:hypothetical protein H8356DRAFT_1756038 [Neocallimastix sp. JGI-2020a]KAG4082807.1 hypothetical protein H8356DRAFT_1752422 [Neocallimastix sp. JGI-2020a]ORX97304.1 hypothetical protein LY90DRAFT_709623 [Neocallimastix californiae]|eukprot:ORX97304.1 hypothetical protein LY90DRAFT_709623 [Neocallimastix californiae]
MNFPKFLFSFLLSINAIYCINLPSNAEGNFSKKDQTKLIKRSHWDNDFNSKIFDDMRKELENNPIYDDMRKELENNSIYDDMRKEMENNPIYDEMRKEMETNPIYDDMRKEMETNPIYDDMRGELEEKQKKTKTTAKKQALPTIFSSDKCGSKKDGIYMCKRNYCCSKYGYCGKSSDYCDSGCQSRYGKCW